MTAKQNHLNSSFNDKIPVFRFHDPTTCLEEKKLGKAKKAAIGKGTEFALAGQPKFKFILLNNS